MATPAITNTDSITELYCSTPNSQPAGSDQSGHHVQLQTKHVLSSNINMQAETVKYYCSMKSVDHVQMYKTYVIILQCLISLLANVDSLQQNT